MDEKSSEIFLMLHSKTKRNQKNVMKEKQLAWCNLSLRKLRYPELIWKDVIYIIRVGLRWDERYHCGLTAKVKISIKSV